MSFIIDFYKYFIFYIIVIIILKPQAVYNNF